MTLAENPSPALKMPRIALIDTLRGVALVAMATYHFSWDLEFFGYLEPGTATQGLFRLYARSIASSFLFLAGVSLVLAHSPAIRWRSFWKRFAMVAGAAAAISVATLFAFPGEWIFFGILHNIALSSLIGLAFLSLPLPVTAAVAVLLAAAAIVDGFVAPGILDWPAFDSRWLAWLGFAEVPPRSNDYVPLFPWLTALLAGVTVTRLALKRNWLLRLAAVQTRPNILSKAGRHSLIVYLVHQPLLIGLVYLFSLVHPAPPPDPRQGYLRVCNQYCSRDGYDKGFCERYCSCGVDELTNQSLLVPLMNNALSPRDGERAQAITRECSIVAQPN